MQAIESNEEILKTLEASARESAAVGREVVPVGPFLAVIDPRTDSPWVNVAIPAGPLGSATSVAAALDRLRGVFADRRRTLRFEFSAALWPTLPAALERAGLVEDARQTVMTAAAGDVPAVEPGEGVRLRRMPADAADALLSEYEAAKGRGFNDDLEPFPPADMRNEMADRRRLCAYAEIDGAIAGTGELTPAGSVAELVGVAVVPEARRRGIGAALCSELCRDWFDGGGTLVWLSAQNAVARQLYQRIGFRDADVLLHYIDAAAVAKP